MSARMSQRKLGAHVGFQARQIFSRQELRIVSRVLRVQLMDYVPMYVRIDCSGAWYNAVLSWHV